MLAETLFSGIRVSGFREIEFELTPHGAALGLAEALPAARLERDLRAKAADHAASRLAASSYLAEHDRISAEIDALEVQPGPPVGDVDEVVAALTSMRDAWRDADLAKGRSWSGGSTSGSPIRTARSSRSS